MTNNEQLFLFWSVKEPAGPNVNGNWSVTNSSILGLIEPYWERLPDGLNLGFGPLYLKDFDYLVQWEGAYVSSEYFPNYSSHKYCT